MIPVDPNKIIYHLPVTTAPAAQLQENISPAAPAAPKNTTPKTDAAAQVHLQPNDHSKTSWNSYFAKHLMIHKTVLLRGLSQRINANVTKNHQERLAKEAIITLGNPKTTYEVHIAKALDAITFDEALLHFFLALTCSHFEGNSNKQALINIANRFGASLPNSLVLLAFFMVELYKVDPAKGSELLSKALPSFKETWGSLFRTLILFEESDPVKRREHFDKIPPEDNKTAVLLQGVFYSDKMEKAIPYWNELLDCPLNKYLAYEVLISYYLDQNRPADINTLITRLQNTEDSAKVPAQLLLLVLSIITYAPVFNGDFELAEKINQGTLEEYPGHPLPLAWSGIIAAYRNKEFRTANDYFMKSQTALKSTKCTPAILYNIYVLYAELNQHDKRYQSTLASHSQKLTLSSNYRFSLYQLQPEDPKKEQENLKHVSNILKSSDAHAIKQMGYLYFRAKRLEAAVEYLGKALSLSNNTSGESQLFSLSKNTSGESQLIRFLFALGVAPEKPEEQSKEIERSFITDPSIDAYYGLVDYCLEKELDQLTKKRLMSLWKIRFCSKDYPLNAEIVHQFVRFCKKSDLVDHGITILSALNDRYLRTYGLCHLYLLKGDFTKAKTHYSELFRLKPDDVNTLVATLYLTLSLEQNVHEDFLSVFKQVLIADVRTSQTRIVIDNAQVFTHPAIESLIRKKLAEHKKSEVLQVFHSVPTEDEAWKKYTRGWLDKISYQPEQINPAEEAKRRVKAQKKKERKERIKAAAEKSLAEPTIPSEPETSRELTELMENISIASPKPYNIDELD